MFEELLETVKKLAAASQRPPFDPAGFNDPVATSTKWTPKMDGDANFSTHLVAVGPERMEFKAPWGTKLFCGTLLFVGLTSMFAIPVALWNHINPLLVLFFGSFGLTFGAIGAVVYRGAQPIVFDRRIGCFWKGRHDPSKEFDRSNIKSLTELSDLHALQLVSHLHRTKSGSHYSYEMNMVFKDGRRQTIVDHRNLEQIRKDARMLGSFLQVPLWDAVG